MKKLFKLLATSTLSLCVAFTALAGTGCSNNGGELAALTEKTNSLTATVDDLNAAIAELKAQNDALSQALAGVADAVTPDTVPEGTLASNYAEEAYEKLVYIDKNVKDRDFIYGDKFEFCQKWVVWELMKYGYSEDDVVFQNFNYSLYVDNAKLSTITADYTTDGKTYVSSGRNKYVEVEEGQTVEEGKKTYSYVTVTTANLIITHEGKTDKQIIVGAHYDGDGAGDNGSSIALAVTTLQHLKTVETEYTIKFVLFSAEEYGFLGSKYYAENMSQDEINNTLYMINMDSLACGDYTYIYGGVVDEENKTVTQTEAFDNAMAIGTALGLNLKSNPYTYENPTPGYDEPIYAAPSTGDWSDHVPFKKIGIPYLYFEATNWDIPGIYYEYDGYGETYLIGMLMNTPNDYLEYIEKYFPGRPLSHLTTFSTLLNALITQSDYVA